MYRSNAKHEPEAQPRAQNTRSGRPNMRSGARGLSAMEGDLDADDDALPPIDARPTAGFGAIRRMLIAVGAPSSLHQSRSTVEDM